MGGGIDPTGHPTNNDEAMPRKVAGEPAGHTRTVGRRMAGAYDCNARTGQKSSISADIQD